VGARGGACAEASLDELAAAVARFERTGNVTPLLARFVAAASSAGGARPKAVIVDGERHYIAKFTSAMDQNTAVERAEVLALKLASAAGIEAPQARILGSKNKPVALIERFDRKVVRGNVQRRHVISAQTFLGAQFADEGDYADLVEQMRVHAEAGQMSELFARVAFNVLVRSTDDHLKNHAFVHVGGGRWLKLDEARQIVDRVARVVAGRWRPLAREVGMSRKSVDYYAAAFEHEEMRSAQHRPASVSLLPRDDNECEETKRERKRESKRESKRERKR